MRKWRTGATALLVAFAGLLVAASGEARDESPHLFVTGDNCMSCHNGMTTRSGEDVSIGSDWSASMMAHSARDPYWQAAVRREILDHPEAQEAIEDECATCHMPMARYEAQTAGEKGEIFSHTPFKPNPGHRDAIAEDGVSCSMCHQIGPEKLGTPESFTGGFHVDTETPLGERTVFGPFAIDSGRQRIMRSATGLEPQQGEHIQSSEMCGSCHTLYTHTLGEGGETIGTLPEQMPYLEWRHSAYQGEQSCQDCHMPTVEETTPITSVLGDPREGFSRHVFRGGNFFMLRMLNRYRGELSVEARSQDLESAAQRTVEHLQSRSARLHLDEVTTENGRLHAQVRVDNLAGHKLPSAYPSRRAWIQLTVRDAAGELVFESGAFQPDGSIAGNDNDADPRSFEPHYERIEDPSQVQIYEGILAGPEGEVTTGLLTAIRYIKDNRLLPKGFEKAMASEDIAVQGAAGEDGDFSGGGDTVRYAVDVAGAQGPFTVEAALWYQPIAYRWAHNLAPYDAFETNRFVRYYRSMSKNSALVLTRARSTTQ